MLRLFLITHSWLRWGVLTAGLLLVVSSLRHLLSGSPWHEGVDRLRPVFLRVLDLQLLLGLALYVGFSPLPRTALLDPGASLADAVLRFYGIEHAFGMLVAAAIAHVGLARAGRRPLEARARPILFTSLVWTLITLVSIPWPFLPYGRPLFRV